MASTINANNTTGLVSTADTSGVLQLQTNGTTAVTVDDSQRAAFVAGTVALPAITTTGDTNTGIFFPAADTIAFAEGGAEAMRIDSSGNLGIGTTSPAAKFDAFQSSIGTYFLGGAGDNKARQLAIKSSTTTNSGDTHTFDAQSGTGVLAFAITGTERARIDSSGNLLVGTTSSSATSGNGLKVTSGSGNADSVSVVTGATTNAGLTTYQLYSTGAGAYRFYVGAGGTIFATSITISAISDQRLKENVRDIDTGLDAIMALKPRRFDWKDGKGQDKKDAAGFIAQEYRDIFPASVSETKAGSDGIEYLTMNHEELIPSLVKAIQEQQVQITTLTQRITALEAK